MSSLLGQDGENRSAAQGEDARGAGEKAELLRRLRIIRGHICGIEKMIEEGKGCSEVLTQLAAIKSSVRKVEECVLEHYAYQCLSRSASGSRDVSQGIREVVSTIMRFVR
ncbi:MAG TPA: metal-sensitive transcriptional regulator [Firmicutes bacterium]|nr:metal-sensitive transcriptional regulator [Bacillota bacterium]